MQHLGAPTTVTASHLDRAIFDRWTTSELRKATERIYKWECDANGWLLKSTQDESEDSGTDKPPKRGRARLQLIQPLPQLRRKASVEFDSESDEDAF